MSLEIAAGLTLGILALLFLFGTHSGLTLFAVAFAFSVVAVLILGMAAMLAMVPLGLALFQPDLLSPLQTMAPWYILVSSGAAVIGGVLGAVRAIRNG